MTPSFNQAHFLEATIRSVILQGYPDLEYIVMDGGSTDGSVEILRRYDPWISSWTSEPDRGQTHAINKGLLRATGDVFTYLNSDDLLAPGALHAVAKAFRECSDADVIYGGCVYIDSDGQIRGARHAEFEGFAEYLRIWTLLERHASLTQPEVFCRTSALRAIGPFREDLHAVMDFEMWLRLLKNECRFVSVDEPLAYFRVHPGQKSEWGGMETCAVVEEYVEAAGDVLAPPLRRRIEAELRLARANWRVHAAPLRGYLPSLVDAARASLSEPALLGSPWFWTVLAHPFRSILPRSLRRWVRRVLASRVSPRETG